MFRNYVRQSSYIMKIFTKSFLLLALLNPFVTSAQNKAAHLDSIFNGFYLQKVFSGNVLIAKNGQVVYQHSFGWADSVKQLHNNEATRFQLASVSKQFTAAGIVALKEAGKLNFDDLLSKYIPELPYPGITIRQLLNHTSGVPDYFVLFDKFWDKSKIASNNDMLAMLIEKHPQAMAAPGDAYNYSNTGYALLAMVIERVSGKSFAEYMQSDVFKPFGLTHALIYTRYAKPLQLTDLATGYVYADSLKRYALPAQHPIWKTALWEDGIYGEDGVNMTAEDLLKWDQQVFNRKVFTAEDWQQILTPGTPKNGTSDYGFGFHLLNQQGSGKAAYHSGGWPGFLIQNEQGLDNNYSIIILRNWYTTQTKMPLDAIRAILQAP